MIQGKRRMIYGPNELSKQEIKVLRTLADGLLYKECADKLYVSKKTIETHVRNILRKLSAKNMTQAVYKYFVLNSAAGLGSPSTQGSDNIGAHGTRHAYK